MKINIFLFSIIATFLRIINSHSVFKSNLIPICELENRVENSLSKNNSRIIVVGDPHGDLLGFLKILYQARIIKSTLSCEWTDQPIGGTTFVQVGDIVDRGANALEIWQCLQHLQESAPQGSKVIRLLGNHELWWLEGHFHMRNPEADTNPKIIQLVNWMMDDVLSGKLVSSYSLRIEGVPILFTHAGIHFKFRDYLSGLLPSPLTAKSISSHLNSLLLNDMQQCGGKDQRTFCKFIDEVYQAGADRGGSSIGGPFWTDFRHIVRDYQNEKDLEEDQKTKPDMIQIVGHSAAHCSPDSPFPSCIRASPYSGAICVDGAMYYGGRSYLEISPVDGHFRTYQWLIDDSANEKPLEEGEERQEGKEEVISKKWSPHFDQSQDNAVEGLGGTVEKPSSSLLSSFLSSLSSKSKQPQKQQAIDKSQININHKRLIKDRGGGLNQRGVWIEHDLTKEEGCPPPSSSSSSFSSSSPPPLDSDL